MGRRRLRVLLAPRRRPSGSRTPTRHPTGRRHRPLHRGAARTGKPARPPRPDLIVGGSFHPLAAWGASVIARRMGVPFVFEPRDLWPESALGLTGMTERHPVIRALRALERTTVQRAAHIVSPSKAWGATTPTAATTSRSPGCRTA
ncbi:glycosyltransferase [Curtobacterium sp. 24E2]|nr:hypothetical protein JN350_05200 [Curtobacterium sp. 24E2]